MRRTTLSVVSSLAVVVVGIGANQRHTDSWAPLLQAAGDEEFFDELDLTFESNTVDQDAEVVLHAETGQPIQRVALVGPGGEVVARIEAGGIGLSEFRLETGEPSPDEVRLEWPAGPYVIRAQTVDGAVYSGVAELFHDVPARFDVVSPVEDSIVEIDGVAIEWIPDPSAERYSLELEGEDDEEVLRLSARSGQSRIAIPEEWLEPGTEYQLVMIAHHECGNRIVQERWFTTAER